MPVIETANQDFSARWSAVSCTSLSFLLASTDLVVELGFVIALFLGWQSVVGEYVGGTLLILWACATVHLTASRRLVGSARQQARSRSEDDRRPRVHRSRRVADGRRLATGRASALHGMEDGLARRDVRLHGGRGERGVRAAFAMFIGSMGDVSLAAVVFDNGVSFAGVMAFLFSDLVVFPVLRISAASFGWKMAIYILVTVFVSLVVTAVALHWACDGLGVLPAAWLVGGLAVRA